MKYTEEQKQYILSQYCAETEYDAQQAILEDLAKKFSVSVHSLRNMLVSEGVYQKKHYTTKRGLTPIKKEDFVTKMEEYFEAYPGTFDSLAKANKEPLRKLMEFVIGTVGDPRGIFESFLYDSEIQQTKKTISSTQPRNISK